MLDPRVLERHLRASLRVHSRPTRVGPFTLFYHPDGAYPTFNLAIPEEEAEGHRVPVQGQDASGLGAVPDDDPDYALMMLEAQFRAHRRTPRVECIIECHPDLPALLLAHGYREEVRVPLLVSTKETWKQIDEIPDMRFEAVLPTSQWGTIRDYLLVQRDAYGLDLPIPDVAPKDAWNALGIGAGVLAVVDGVPVGAGGFTLPQEGVAEIHGLAVAHAARRKGIGAFLLSALARVAHEGGIQTVLVTPEGAATARVARRAGFVPVATLVCFTMEAAAGP